MLLSTARNLPNYLEPPVTETVIGFQFNPVAGFTNAHLGAFWQTLGPHEWPKTSDAPALGQQFEEFTDEAKWVRQLRLQLTTEIAPRLQIANKAGDQMIQVQNGRLHFNWRREGDKPYPSYESNKACFQSYLEKLIKFLADWGLPPILPNQWEVTYVNVIPQGTVWQKVDDWNFLRLIAPVSGVQDVVSLESINSEWHFLIPGKRGRLHLQWSHGFSDELKREAVRLTLTARGPLAPSDDAVSSVLGGCDLGHYTIVQAFRHLMSDAANSFWKLNDKL
jgi:uncharacterized protein (TIGR04255 family)